MLPKFLQNSYKRYKTDTATLTSWLAIQGERCGVDDIVSIASKDSGSKTVKLRQLKVWARAIAKSKIKVPSSVLAAGRRAVSLRTRCNDWFQRKIGAGGKAHQDEAHKHFIQTLEEILTTLEWETILPHKSKHTSSSTKSTKNDKAGDTDTASVLSNSFSALEVEDYDTDGGTEPSPATTRSTDAASTISGFELDESQLDETEEKMFATFCLFDDLQKIRNFLDQTWKDYAANKIDLMAASVTTNTALDLAHEQCGEFVKRYPDLDGFQGATTSIFIMASFTTGNGPNHKERPGDSFDYGLMDVAEWCLFPTYQQLDAFTRVLTGKHVPVYNGQYGWYNAEAKREKMSVRERYDDDRRFLMQHLSEFAFLADFKYPLPVIDELTRGLVDMCKTKIIPIWLAFATQIFLDVKNAVRAHGNQAFSDLRMTGLRTKKTIDDHFKVHEKLPDAAEANWAKQNDGVLREVKTIIETFIEKDWYLSCLKKDVMRAGAEVVDYALYKAHPLLCGVLVFHLNIRMQELGLILMNAWGTGLYAAYMYNAIQQDAAEIDVSWPDMDKLIELHTEEHLFYGQRPTDHEDSFKKICLATGVAASAFPAGAKFPKRLSKNKEARGLEERSVISRVYRKRYCYGETIDLSTANIQAVLDDLAGKKVAAEAGSKRMKKKFKRTQRLTPLQLLTALQERLVDEEQSLKFNYIGMNSRVIQLFQLTKQAVDPQMMSKFGPDYMSDERQICAIVHFMLTYASLATQGMRQIGAYKPGMKLSSKCISAAGNVLQKWSLANGNVAVKELDAFCTNKPKLDAVARASVREKQVVFFFSLDELLSAATAA